MMKKTFLGLLSLALLYLLIVYLYIPSRAQSAVFSSQIIDQNNSGDDKAIADILGDGKGDGIVGGSTLTWYETASNYAPHQIATASNEFTTGMQAQDVDGDGDPDMILADGNGVGNVMWFENPRNNPPPRKTNDPRDGNNWTWHTIGTHGEFAHDIQVCDLNGDGKLDVVTSGHGHAHVFLQQTKDSWRDIDISFLAGSGIALADVNRDGKLDIVTTNGWLENNGDGTQWTPHTINGMQGDAVGAGDLNGDGKSDIIVADGHNKGHPALIFYQPADLTSPNWQMQVLDPDQGGHTPRIVDFNNDGKNDILLGLEKVETSVYINQGGGNFQKTIIDTASGHNAAVGDINGDGKLDIFAADYIGNPPVKVYINQMQAGNAGPTPTLQPGGGGGGTAGVDKWTYIHVTSNHQQTFGLTAGDIDGDGKPDIISGPYWYKSPGGDLTGNWQQSQPFPNNIHGALAYDVNGDGMLDVIGQVTENGQLAIYALLNSGGGKNWTPVHMGDLPQASHALGAQGFKLAKIRGGSKPEIVFTSGGGMYYFVIPPDPSQPNWEKVQVSSNTSDEGIGVGDVDGDGKIDLASTTGDSKNVEWYKNPGNGSGNWQVIHVGDMQDAVFPDRTEIIDLDGDGKPDIMTTSENGLDSGAQAYWFKNPGGTAGNWEKHLLGAYGDLNSGSVADLNNDGKPEIILGEQKGQQRVIVWENLGGGQFTEHAISQGHESHMGVYPFDLNGDGATDIISIAYDSPQDIHLWRNDNVSGGVKPTNPPGNSCPTHSQGDANCDGTPDVIDYAVWRAEYLKQVTTTTADFNGDGVVTLADFQIWKNNFK